MRRNYVFTTGAFQKQNCWNAVVTSGPRHFFLAHDVGEVFYVKVLPLVRRICEVRLQKELSNSPGRRH